MVVSIKTLGISSSLDCISRFVFVIEIRTVIYFVLIRALSSLHQLNTDKCTQTQLGYHFINTIYVSTLKVPTSESTLDTFKQQSQQNESPDVKFNFMCAVCYAPLH
jgi:hypothetical protein